MKNITLSTLLVLITLLSAISPVVISEKNTIYNTIISGSDYSKPTVNFIPVHIEGKGNIYSPLFYLSHIPWLLVEFLYFCCYLLGFNPSFPLLDEIQEVLSGFLLHLADFRDTWLPLFVSCPYMWVSGGRYWIDDDEGNGFDGSLSGFTGIAHEFDDGRILVKGFAKKVRY